MLKNTLISGCPKGTGGPDVKKIQYIFLDLSLDNEANRKIRLSKMAGRLTELHALGHSRMSI